MAALLLRQQRGSTCATAPAPARPRPQRRHRIDGGQAAKMG